MFQLKLKIVNKILQKVSCESEIYYWILGWIILKQTRETFERVTK